MLIALLAYGVALIATAPASVATRFVAMPPAVVALSGTIWNGEALLRGGARAQWGVRKLASLASFALTLDWTVEGAGTRLAGRAALRPGGGALSDVAGAAGWDLVRAFAPDPPVACDLSVRIELPALGFDGTAFAGGGVLRSGPGRCTRTAGSGAAPVELPPLTARIDAEQGDLRIQATPTETPDLGLGAARLTPAGALTLTIEPAGARLIPGMPTGGATEITLELWQN